MLLSHTDVDQTHNLRTKTSKKIIETKFEI